MKLLKNYRLVCLAIAFGFCFLISNTNAQTLPQPLSPTVVFTTDAQGTAITGASNVNSGDSPADSDFYIRERRSATQTDRRISAFLNFDVSSLTPAIVNQSGFSVALTADYEYQLNNLNSTSALVGRVTNGAWNGTSTRPLHSWGIDDSASRTQLISDIRALAPPASVSADVTNIVIGWVNGGTENYGMAIFIDELESNAAGFSNAQLVFSIDTSIPPNPDETPDGVPEPEVPFVDTDGDSYRDEAEVAFGSDPNDPASIPDHRRQGAKPNVVIIYADDLGFGDISAYGNLYDTLSSAPTPNIDALAANGTMFTQGHSANGICTPSRYSLLTGRYNFRLFNGFSNNYGNLGNLGGELPQLSDVTIAEFMKTQQYDTAAMGKWHLGGSIYARNGGRITNNPADSDDVDWERRVDLHATDNGFDYFRGNAMGINFAPYVYMVDDRMQFFDTTLNGGAGAFRAALNTDQFRFFTRAELNSTVIGARGSRDGPGRPILHTGRCRSAIGKGCRRVFRGSR